MRTDLHIHTTASDGCWTPERVIDGVRALGIGLFAVADHDTTANVGATEALARAVGIGFLRAVEVSTMDRSSGDDGLMLHILGYGIDLGDAALQQLIRENETLLEITDDANVKELQQRGYAIDLEAYATYEHDRTRGGWKSLNFLIDRGVCAGEKEFFRVLWPQMTHRWPDFAHPTAAVDAIRAAGGLPILAHPGASFDRQHPIEEGLHRALAYGIAGVECYSYAHNDATIARCVDWCARHNLLITGGSDYHGGFAGRALGVPAVDTSRLYLGDLASKIVWGEANHES